MIQFTTLVEYQHYQPGYFLGPGISQEILPTNLKRFLGDVLYFAKLFMVFMTRGVKQQTIGNLHPIIGKTLREYFNLI